MFADTIPTTTKLPAFPAIGDVQRRKVLASCVTTSRE